MLVPGVENKGSKEGVTCIICVTFNPIQDGHFQGCSQIGTKKGPPS